MTEESPVTIRIEVGANAQLSARLRAALEELSTAVAEADLGGGEVEGFAFGAGGGSFMDVGGLPKPDSKFEPPIKAGGCIGNYYDEESNSSSCWINWS